MTNTCPHCGVPLKEGIHFCGECGKPIVAEEDHPADQVSEKKPTPKGTMIGVQSPLYEEKIESDEESQKLAPSTRIGVGQTPLPAEKSSPLAKGKTMIGIPAQYAKTIEESKESSTKESGQLDESDGKAGLTTNPLSNTPSESADGPTANKPGFGKTMLGIAPEAIASLSLGKTKIGTPQLASPVPGEDADGDSSRHSAESPESQSQTSQMEDDLSQAEASPSHRAGKTILGLPTAGDLHTGLPSIKKESKANGKGTPPQPEEHGTSQKSSIPPETGRTMLGVAVASISEDTESEPESPDTDKDGHSISKTTIEPIKKQRKRSIGPLLFLCGLLLVIGTAYFFIQRGTTPKVKARVVSMDMGEGLLFEAAGVPVGTKIRFGGQEQTMEAGRATFRLASESLRVGENTVVIDLLYPDGKTEPAKLVLDVDFRIRIDTSPLQTDPPAIDVIVNAHEGTKVSLDGEAVKLNSDGEVVKRFPIDADSSSTSGTVKKVIQYRIQPPSKEAIVDRISTQIAIATMQIDRPGQNAVTDKESIELAGAVAPNSSLTIDGNKVPIRSGRFLYHYALPKPGTYTPQIVATEPGKAPQARRIKIRRVADLNREAETFEANPSLTFARIAQNPSIYRGQKVDFTGRVYNVNVQEGQSVLQVLVRECPTGQRCSLWVTYPAATDAVINSWIRILGVVDGQQQFRSENGRVVTVPKVTASLILSKKR